MEDLEQPLFTDLDVDLSKWETPSENTSIVLASWWETCGVFWFETVDESFHFYASMEFIRNGGYSDDSDEQKEAWRAYKAAIGLWGRKLPSDEMIEEHVENEEGHYIQYLGTLENLAYSQCEYARCIREEWVEGKEELNEREWEELEVQAEKAVPEKYHSDFFEYLRRVLPLKAG